MRRGDIVMRSRSGNVYTMSETGNIMEAHKFSDMSEPVYEYWCDGERVREFADKNTAIRCWKTNCHKSPNSQHTIFKVYPTRKAVCQHVP